jgi:hypothetical protein
MESAGAPGRVNVSAATHAALAGALSSEPRGLVAAKGKGMVEMYFLGSTVASV